MSFFSDLFGNFTGKQSQKELTRGRGAAIGAIDAGERGAIGDYEQAEGYFDEAGNFVAPYEAGGREGFDAYRRTLTGTPEERKAIADAYFNDPTNNAILDRVTKANARLYTGRGKGISGEATSGLTTALLDRWGAHQDRLRDLGNTGFAAAGQMGAYKAGKAGVRTGMGGIRFGAGQQRAGLETSYSNAIAASKSTGINNLFKIAEIASKFVPGGGGGGSVAKK